MEQNTNISEAEVVSEKKQWSWNKIIFCSQLFLLEVLRASIFGSDDIHQGIQHISMKVIHFYHFYRWKTFGWALACTGAFLAACFYHASHPFLKFKDPVKENLHQAHNPNGRRRKKFEYNSPAAFIFAGGIGLMLIGLLWQFIHFLSGFENVQYYWPTYLSFLVACVLILIMAIQEISNMKPYIGIASILVLFAAGWAMYRNDVFTDIHHWFSKDNSLAVNDSTATVVDSTDLTAESKKEVKTDQPVQQENNNTPVATTISTNNSDDIAKLNERIDSTNRNVTIIDQKATTAKNDAHTAIQSASELQTAIDAGRDRDSVLLVKIHDVQKSRGIWSPYKKAPKYNTRGVSADYVPKKSRHCDGSSAVWVLGRDRSIPVQ